MQKDKVIYRELSFKINGILFRVKKNLGQYKNELQYCDGIANELANEKLKFEREKILPESFIGESKGRNRIDFLIEDKIILEVKSKQFITKNDYYQVRRYLDALHKKLAILVNMRNYYVRPKRILNSDVKIIDL